MQYGNRLIRYLISLVFIGVFLLFSQPSEAEINVGGWKNFGYNLNDFSLNDYTASNSAGESYDLRKDIDYLGYRGENIAEDVTLNGAKIKPGQYYHFNTSPSIPLIIKKMGIHNGRYLELRITPEYTPMQFKINADGVNPLLETLTFDLNSSATRYDIKMSLFYEGTNTKPTLENGRQFLLPIKFSNGWPDYNFAMLVERSTKILIGDQPRDTIARERSKTYMDTSNSKYRIAIGNAPANKSIYLYNALFNKTTFFIGKQSVGNWNSNSIGLFEPIDAPSSVPKPYNDVTFESKTLESDHSKFYSEINYSIPVQDKESFIPGKIEIDIHGKYIDDYDRYDVYDSSKRGMPKEFFYNVKPTLTVDNSVIDSDQYIYDTYLQKLTFSKDFLKNYSGKTIQIKTRNIGALYYTDAFYKIKKYYLGDFKFKIPTSLKVTSYYDTFSRVEFDEESSTIIELGIDYDLTPKATEIQLNKKTEDYDKSYFVSKLVSGNWHDTLTYEIVPKTFSKLSNAETFTVRIFSTFYEASILVELPIKVYEPIPIIYQLEDGTLITSGNENLTHEVKRYSETPVKFKIPYTFDNYTFVSSSNEELQFGETVDNFKEATGLLNTTTKEIGLIYKMNKIGVTVEYLLDSETGKYEKHQPIKVGTALNQDKPNIQFETEIGQKIIDFIKNNKDQVNPEIPYYHNHQETGKTANYWRYSDEPVSDKNPLRPVDSEDKIPSRPITITSFYSGTASLNSVDDIDFGTHKNNLKVNEITSKKAINYSFVDTTFNKQTSLNVRFDVPIKNETNQKMTAFLLDYKGKSINQQDVPVIKSQDTEKNIFTGDLKSDLLFKRYWLGPENFGQFSGVLVWTISRDITP